MKLLVTGGAGFIGSAVVRKAVALGLEVLNLDCLTYSGNLANVAAVATRSNYAFAQADIRDPDALRDVFGRFRPDAVIHLAAETHVDRSIDGPATFIDTNVRGTFNLLEASRACWIAAGRPDTFRFLHVSTDEVFGSLDEEGTFTEESPYAPRSPYAASKAAADHLALAWHETYRLPVIVTNSSNNYGPCQFPEKLIPLVVLSAVAGRPIPVYGRGENVRNWLHVDDHADALLRVAEAGQPGRSYNIGGPEEARNIDLVRNICALLDTSGRLRHKASDLITFVQDRPGHDHRYAIDSTRIRRELGWAPAKALAEGLPQTVMWYLDNEPWWRPLLTGTEFGSRLGLNV